MVTRCRLLKSDCVALKEQKVRVPSGEGQQYPDMNMSLGKGAEPQVDITRASDGTIEAITVRCTCGRETTLHCEYPDEGEKK
jgi:hypothetical protein